jgi:hypothetical protein
MDDGSPRPPTPDRNDAGSEEWIGATLIRIMAGAPHPLNRRLDRVREGRRLPPETTASLRDFLPAQFQREHARPLERLGQLVELWRTTMPPAVVERSMLVSFSRGVLTVHVDAPATLYEADRALRGGAEQQLRAAFRGGALRRVRLAVEPNLT